MIIKNPWFIWTSDRDDDGTPETVAYQSRIFLPTIDPIDGGGKIPTKRFEGLNRNIIRLVNRRSGYIDQRSPGNFTLNWSEVPRDLVNAVEEDYARQRIVEIRADQRWRQLLLASSGLPNRQVSVDGGYLRYNGDTFFLRGTTTYTCGATDTLIYVTPSTTTGLLTLGSGTEVPGGSTKLTDLTIAGDVVTITSEYPGVFNARRGYVSEFKMTKASGPYVSLNVTIDEVR